jgi:hypothetical protein
VSFSFVFLLVLFWRKLPGDWLILKMWLCLHVYPYYVSSLSLHVSFIISFHVRVEKQHQLATHFFWFLLFLFTSTWHLWASVCVYKINNELLVMNNEHVQECIRSMWEILMFVTKKGKKFILNVFSSNLSKIEIKNY